LALPLTKECSWASVVLTIGCLGTGAASEKDVGVLTTATPP
jgi:hypothetical protein